MVYMLDQLLVLLVSNVVGVHTLHTDTSDLVGSGTILHKIITLMRNQFTFWVKYDAPEEKNSVSKKRCYSQDTES